VIVLHLWDLPDSDRDMSGRLDAAVIAADITERHRIELAVETIPCTHNSPVRNVASVIERDPRIGVALDTEFLAYHDEFEAAIESDWLWEPGVVRHVHLKDFAGS